MYTLLTLFPLRNENAAPLKGSAKPPSLCIGVMGHHQTLSGTQLHQQCLGEGREERERGRGKGERDGEEGRGERWRGGHTPIVYLNGGLAALTYLEV